jgi:predicted amidohydrolase
MDRPTLTVAAAQMDCTAGDPDANTAAMVAWTERAAREGADLVVFPELADTGYDLRLAADAARRADGRPLQALRGAAAGAGIAVVAGLSEWDGARVYNTQVAIAPGGEVLARYRKVHLFALAPGDESRVFAAGDAQATFALHGWRVGLAICYDLRFPEAFRSPDAADDLLVVSAAWPLARIAHWRTLMLARALENQAFAVGANRAGADGRADLGGRSLVVSPTGDVLAEADTTGERLLAATLDRADAERFRQAIPTRQHARPDTYGR